MKLKMVIYYGQTVFQTNYEGIPESVLLKRELNETNELLKSSIYLKLNGRETIDGKKIGVVNNR